MTFDQLSEHLTDTRLFSTEEVKKIVQTCGTATLGNAVIACELLKIELSGNDIDEVFNDEIGECEPSEFALCLGYNK